MSAAVGRGEGHTRHVVRDTGPQADRRDPRLAEGELERAPHPRRHVDLALDDADARHEVGRLLGRGGRQAHRPGVGGRGGEGAQPHHESDAELCRQRHHGIDERGPAEVRLGPDQVTDVGTVAIGSGPQLDDRPREPFVHPVGDVHDRSPGTLIDERFSVEGGDQLGRIGRQQRGDGAVCPQTGVDPSVEGHHQHGTVQVACAVALVEGHAPVPLTSRPMRPAPSGPA